MEYYKYETLGNNVLIIFDQELERSSIIKLCSKEFGLAVNRVLVFKTIEEQIKIYDNQGNELKSCLDSIRCLASYLVRHNSDLNEFTIKSKYCDVLCKCINEQEIELSIDKYSLKTSEIPVDCRKQKFLKEIIIIDTIRYELSSVNMGEPNTVIFTKLKDIERLKKIGRVVSRSPIFFDGTSVSFVNVIDKDKLEINVYNNNLGFDYISSQSILASAYFGKFYSKCSNNLKVLSSGYEVDVDVTDRFSIKAPLTLISSGTIHF